MRLKSNWRALVRHAWSLRFLALGVACDGVAMLVSFYTDAPEPYRTGFALAGTAATIAGGLARLMPQTTLPEEGA